LERELLAATLTSASTISLQGEGRLRPSACERWGERPGSLSTSRLVGRRTGLAVSGFFPLNGECDSVEVCFFSCR
jgi:hypothetical protein